MFISLFCCVCVYLFNICLLGTSLVVRCLRLCISNAGDVGSIPIWRTKIPYAQWCGREKKKSLLYDIFCNKHMAKRKKKLWNATQLLKNEADICPDMARSPRHTD